MGTPGQWAGAVGFTIKLSQLCHKIMITVYSVSSLHQGWITYGPISKVDHEVGEPWYMMESKFNFPHHVAKPKDKPGSTKEQQLIATLCE